MSTGSTPTDRSFWRTLADHLQTGQPAFVAAVADHTRHSPGSRGAKMLVRPDGSQYGTIGGGAMEADVLRRAAASIASGDVNGDFEILEHKRETEGRYNPSGLICAGRQTMAYWLAHADDAAVYSTFADAVRKDREVELRVVDGVPDAIESALDLSSPSVTIEEGAPLRFSEHSVQRHRVAICGGGHCGAAVSRAMAQLGYRVAVYDVRGDLFTLEENDWSDETVVVSDYVDVGPQVTFAELTHFVVMTADMMSDIRALEGAAGIEFPYVGVMGSAAKLRAIRETLAERGVDASAWPNFYAPIGLEMTSNTPAEIAVSVAAQILRERETLFPWTRPAALGS